MDQRHWNLPGVPICDILWCINIPYLKPFMDTVIVVTEPVSDQHRFPISRLNQIFQDIQFPVMEQENFPLFPVYRSICHLLQLIRQSRRISCIQFLPV